MIPGHAEWKKELTVFYAGGITNLCNGFPRRCIAHLSEVSLFRKILVCRVREAGDGQAQAKEQACDVTDQHFHTLPPMTCRTMKTVSIK